MQRAGWKQALLIMMGLGLAACVSPLGGGPDRTVASSTGSLVTVHPHEINDVLYNPGMGFADFHFGFGHPPQAEEYPHTTVAYFRWPWAELEPAEGQYNFALVDRVIEQAKAKGETLAIRIVSEYKTGTPKWVLDKGVGSVKESDGIFPDYNNPIFLDYHERLIRAFGERYGRSLDIDHVDIGSVGCWGEWNTACCEGVETQCKAYFPTDANQLAITDWYFKYFAGTPLVMLHGGQLQYATARGAGWRGDCFGDYGYFSPTGITWSRPTRRCWSRRWWPMRGSMDRFKWKCAATSTNGMSEVSTSIGFSVRGWSGTCPCSMPNRNRFLLPGDRASMSF